MEDPGEPTRALRFGVFQIDLGAGELYKHGLQKIDLQPQPFRILAKLLERLGAVVTRDELRKELWPAGTFVDFEHRLNAAINKLREALGDSAENPRFIETLARRGYRFIGTVEKLDRVSRHEQRPAKSLAVLPLQSLSGDPEQDYFADGMTDELIATLAKITSLRVVSRSSVMTYKGANKTLPQIARELNVDAIVEGTVLRSGDRVQITAQLVHAEADQHLWAETYERDVRDILTLQSEIARAIAQEVQTKLTPLHETYFATTRRVDPTAYEAYLRGRYFWNQTKVETLDKAIGYFNQAIEKAPDCALAYSGLADAYAALGLWGLRAIPPREALQKAKEAAVKALQISDQLAEPHTSLAQVSFYHDWDFSGAEEEFKRSTELNPSYPIAHLHYSIYLATMGRAPESLTEIQWAFELDPCSLIVHAGAGWRSYLAREYDTAIQQLRKALDMDPTLAAAHFFLGLAWEQKGSYEEAVAEFQGAKTLSGGSSMAQAALGHAYAIAGREGAAHNVLAMLEVSSKSTRVPAYHIAAIFVGLGDRDKAVEWLDKAYEEHSPWMVYLKASPRFDPLRSDPRLQALLRRMNFPP